MPSSLRPAAALALLVLVPATGAAGQSFGKLDFMTGCWQGSLSERTVVEEWWMPPSDNLVLGLTRYLEKSRATGWEFSFIERTDSGMVFVPQPRGQKADTFQVKVLVDEAAIFERGGEDFPQRIMYRLTSDGSLIARLEGEGQRSLEVRMARVKCPGR